ncbi:MAG: DUF1329 domain-containing protein [Deltaproteobacteria bacterium]|nr:DUF1329 domain-containing protein [Deltaproteobacteria bacterium]
MRKPLGTLIVLFFVISLCASGVQAARSAEEIDSLGKSLTPLGGEKAGNADGTIPAWEGGITAPPAGYTPGAHHPDPYADDPVLFKITKANMEEYADKISEGHKTMFKASDAFYMNVYPTRRSASHPQRIYDATKKYAATAELTEGGNGIKGTVIGAPFPIPQNGLEVIWNHIVRYRGEFVDRTFAYAPVTRGGSYTLGIEHSMIRWKYSLPGMTEEKLDNVILMFRQDLLAPPRSAGRILLVHDTLDQEKEARKAWTYNPGQRRVRRAPQVAFDCPGMGSDGLRTTDDYDMFNGSPQRYDWKLVGKKEMIVPYNAYKLHSDQLKYADIIRPLHLNPEHLRYELHRVWVVEANLKEGTRHIYKKRVFYFDEDSWNIVVKDQYDNRDKLWRFSEGHLINYYDVPTPWYTCEGLSSIKKLKKRV